MLFDIQFREDLLYQISQNFLAFLCLMCDLKEEKNILKGLMTNQ